jgi:hypothetical protein
MKGLRMRMRERTLSGDFQSNAANFCMTVVSPAQIVAAHVWPEVASYVGLRETTELGEIDKICRSSVSRLQTPFDRTGLQQKGRGFVMGLPDHGLPLVQLKEQRRDLVVALQNRSGPVSSWELMQIAAIQQAISAFEDVIADLDAELEMEAAA